MISVLNPFGGTFDQTFQAPYLPNHAILKKQAPLTSLYSGVGTTSCYY